MALTVNLKELAQTETAIKVMKDFLNEKFPNTWTNLTYEHVDASGFWFSFELVNDQRRQRWCIRHCDLTKGKRDE